MMDRAKPVNIFDGMWTCTLVRGKNTAARELEALTTDADEGAASSTTDGSASGKKKSANGAAGGDHQNANASVSLKGTTPGAGAPAAEKDRTEAKSGDNKDTTARTSSKEGNKSSKDAGKPPVAAYKQKRTAILAQQQSSTKGDLAADILDPEEDPENVREVITVARGCFPMSQIRHLRPDGQWCEWLLRAPGTGREKPDPMPKEFYLEAPDWTKFTLCEEESDSLTKLKKAQSDPTCKKIVWKNQAQFRPPVDSQYLRHSMFTDLEKIIWRRVDVIQELDGRWQFELGTMQEVSESGNRVLEFVADDPEEALCVASETESEPEFSFQVSAKPKIRALGAVISAGKNAEKKRSKQRSSSKSGSSAHGGQGQREETAALPSDPSFETNKYRRKLIQTTTETVLTVKSAVVMVNNQPASVLERDAKNDGCPRFPQTLEERGNFFILESPDYNLVKAGGYGLKSLQELRFRVQFPRTEEERRIRMRWVREPEPDAKVRRLLKGLVGKWVLEVYAEHESDSPESYMNVTVEADGTFRVEGEIYRYRLKGPNKQHSTLHFDLPQRPMVRTKEEETPSLDSESTALDKSNDGAGENSPVTSPSNGANANDITTKQTAALMKGGTGSSPRASPRRSGSGMMGNTTRKRVAKELAARQQALQEASHSAPRKQSAMLLKSSCQAGDDRMIFQLCRGGVGPWQLHFVKASPWSILGMTPGEKVSGADGKKRAELAAFDGVYRMLYTGHVKKTIAVTTTTSSTGEVAASPAAQGREQDAVSGVSTIAAVSSTTSTGNLSSASATAVSTIDVPQAESFPVTCERGSFVLPTGEVARLEVANARVPQMHFHCPSRFAKRLFTEEELAKLPDPRKVIFHLTKAARASAHMQEFYQWMPPSSGKNGGNQASRDTHNTNLQEEDDDEEEDFLVPKKITLEKITFLDKIPVENPLHSLMSPKLATYLAKKAPPSSKTVHFAESVEIRNLLPQLGPREQDFPCTLALRVHFDKENHEDPEESLLQVVPPA
ncbi:unnamed protein product, partial [Amoebophrya sp. A25]|eukprot:GSA25T00027334001.1